MLGNLKDSSKEEKVIKKVWAKIRFIFWDFVKDPHGDKTPKFGA